MAKEEGIVVGKPTALLTAKYLTPSGHVVLYDADVTLPGKLSIGSHGYAQCFVNGRVTLFHRWLLGLTVGDGLVGDHVDRNVLDCRRSNLRRRTPTGSNLNRGPSDDPAYATQTRSGRWQAKVKRLGKTHNFGTYNTAAEARQVVQAWLQGRVYV